MKKLYILTIPLFFGAILYFALSNSDKIEKTANPLKFKKRQIASESFETVGVFDVWYWGDGSEFEVRGLRKKWSGYSVIQFVSSPFPMILNWNRKGIPIS